MTHESRDAFDRLVRIAERLLGDDGCPWDREQTISSVTPYLQEETFEILDAVARGDGRSVREELGDMFYLLVFAAALGEKAGFETQLAGVLHEVSDKLVRRHPHVFGETDVTESGGAVLQWEEIKKLESKSDTVLGSRPPGLPALTTAYRIQEKAAAVRFEWTDVRGALAKLREEISELEEILDSEEGADERIDEIGDVLYSVVNVARYVGVDPELALRGTIGKFTRRFQFIESELKLRGRTPSESDLEEMDALWNEAKRRGIR